MNDIINDVENLKQIIIDSKEYSEYTRLTNILDKNEEVNKIIDKIKKLQQEVVNLEANKKDISSKEVELEILFDKLNSIEEYKNYLDASKKLNNIITNVQNNFSNCFNEIIN